MSDAANANKWSEKSWNPVVGCTRVSRGCDNCYAKALTVRFPSNYPDGFALTLKPERMDQPIHWRKPRKIFVNSMSDLFHPGIPTDYLRRIWDVMLEHDHHTYIILTKRQEVMRNRITRLDLPLPKHVWLGVSVEDQEWAEQRLPALLDCAPETAIVSAQPLLDPLDLSPWLPGLDWVIVGSEGGAGRRPMNLDWARSVRDQCQEAGVPFFYKGGNQPGHGIDLDGVVHSQYPGQREVQLAV